jgi:hypothetical protein
MSGLRGDGAGGRAASKNAISTMRGRIARNVWNKRSYTQGKVSHIKAFEVPRRGTRDFIVGFSRLDAGRERTAKKWFLRSRANPEENEEVWPATSRDGYVQSKHARQTQFRNRHAGDDGQPGAIVSSLRAGAADGRQAEMRSAQREGRLLEICETKGRDTQRKVYHSKAFEVSSMGHARFCRRVFALGRVLQASGQKKFSRACATPEESEEAGPLTSGDEYVESKHARQT